MVKMICMANSWRPGGRCVAGIDIETGEWIRPVLRDQNAIPEGATVFGNHPLEPLDVIEMDLAAPKYKTRFQKENRIITSEQWAHVDRVTADDVLQYCSDNWNVLHSSAKVVKPDVLEIKPPDEWTSLELRRVADVTFEPDDRKENRWKAMFRTGAISASNYSLSLTDPIATERLNEGEDLDGEWLLTLSLTEPIAMPQYGLPELCYKLVAAAIPLE